MRVFVTSQNRQTKVIERLHAKIGQLLMKRDYVAEAWGKGKSSVVDNASFRGGACSILKTYSCDMLI